VRLINYMEKEICTTEEGSNKKKEGGGGTSTPIYEPIRERAGQTSLKGVTNHKKKHSKKLRIQRSVSSFLTLSLAKRVRVVRT